MGLLDQYRIDKDLAKSGVKMELPEGNWITMCYAGASNPSYAKALQDVLKPYRRNVNKLSPEQDRELLAKVYAKSIIIDWGGPDFEEPFSEQSFVKLVTDFPEFFADVQEMASNMQYFAEDYVEETAKN